jgi:transcriptional regulator with XRE-family HTH domain
MNFSRTVKQVMSRKNINASDLARKMGYSPQYISDLLACKKRWNETTMEKACDALGISIGYFDRDHIAILSRTKDSHNYNNDTSFFNGKMSKLG